MIILLDSDGDMKIQTENKPLYPDWYQNMDRHWQRANTHPSNSAAIQTILEMIYSDWWYAITLILLLYAIVTLNSWKTTMKVNMLGKQIK